MFAEIKGVSQKLGNANGTKIADFLDYETRMGKYMVCKNITDVKRYARHQAM
jgi:hypothetical protein